MEQQLVHAKGSDCETACGRPIASGHELGDIDKVTCVKCLRGIARKYHTRSMNVSVSLDMRLDGFVTTGFLVDDGWLAGNTVEDAVETYILSTIREELGKVNFQRVRVAVEFEVPDAEAE